MSLQDVENVESKTLLLICLPLVPTVKLASAYAALALGLSTFTTLLVRAVCTRTHGPGLGDVKL